jgi:hypothetical protein
VKERPYESTDLPSVIEIYTASIRSLAASYYSPDQIAAWAPVPPDAARWRERLIFTPSSPSLTVFLRVSLPIHTRATSTFFSLIPLLPVVVLPPASTSASSRHCVRSAPRELRPTPVLSPGHSSTVTAFNSIQRSASSAEVLTSAGSPCTNKSAMSEAPNRSLEPAAGPANKLAHDSFNTEIRSEARFRQQRLSSLSLGVVAYPCYV